MNKQDKPPEPPDSDPVDSLPNGEAQKPEKDKHRETDIIVNSRERTVQGHKVTFEQVVLLAFPSSTPPPPGQAYVYSMTYRHAASAPHAGELGPGGEVHVKEGTIFNVSRTVQS